MSFDIFDMDRECLFRRNVPEVEKGAWIKKLEAQGWEVGHGSGDLLFWRNEEEE